MAYFYLYDGTNTLDLDATVQSISLGGTKRSYEVLDFAGANGGSIRGTGNYSAKSIIVTRKEKRESGDATAWNSRRSDFMVWFTKPFYTTVYFYIVDGENNKTFRTRVYCQELDEDQYKYFGVTQNERAFKLISPSGVFINTTATTGTANITSSMAQTVAITNGGLIECPIKLKFTPTGNESLFSVTMASGYGVVLEKTSFTAAVQIVYDTADGSLTFGGSTQNPIQFITAGSVFLVPPGTSNVSVQCSGPGTFAWELSERYI